MTVPFACTEDSGLTNSGCTFVTTDARYNANLSRAAWRTLGTAPYLDCVGESALTDFWMHIAWASRFADDDGTYPMRFYNAAGTEVFRIDVLAPSDIFQAYYWNGSTMVAVGATWTMPTTVSGGVHECVIHVECGGSGNFECYYDGALVSSGAVGSASCDNIKRVRFADSDSSLTYGTFYSEMIFADESLVGASLETQWPTSDGADTDGSGTYADVDESLRSDSDYVQLASIGDKHSFGIAAFTETQDAVLAYVVSAVLACDASGPSQARAYVVVSGTRYYSAPKLLTLSAVPYNFIWEVNPATGVAWTPAEAEAVTEFGIEAYA